MDVVLLGVRQSDARADPYVAAWAVEPAWARSSTIRSCGWLSTWSSRSF